MDHGGQAPDSQSRFSRSYDSALCLIPPDDSWQLINSVRSLYDKSYDIWPPHVNLIYPFVSHEELTDAVDILRQIDFDAIAPKHINLQQADYFAHKSRNTIILRPTETTNNESFTSFVNSIRQRMNLAADDNTQLHLTVGQTEDKESDSHKFLLEKARLMAPISWDVGQLAILTRERAVTSSVSAKRMRLWGQIDIHTRQVHLASNNAAVPLPPRDDRNYQPSFKFDPLSQEWCPLADIDGLASPAENDIKHFIVASYNVLAEFEWPPQAARYPTLISNILSYNAAADVLVLQEVTDHFLPYLLRDASLRSQYPYSTHRPPGERGAGPLPSLLNVVVLSKLPFQWEYASFSRKHKGAAVIKFPTLRINVSHQQSPLPLVLAGCHLTQGLSDGAVVAKKNELHKLLEYLSKNFNHHPWIIAGDFNLVTSSLTIDIAKKRNQVSVQGYEYLCEIDRLMTEFGLQDAWLYTKLRKGTSRDMSETSAPVTDLYEGEQGATFDPFTNELAAKATGIGFGSRPQRYDRILFNTALGLQPSGFNTFGRPGQATQSEPLAASDHWGIRCLFNRRDLNECASKQPQKSANFELRKASPSLGGTESLKRTLASLSYLPSPEDEFRRESAIQHLKQVLFDSIQNESKDEQRSWLELVLVPLGSYGLGVWTHSSDLDCLCIGNISSKTFFTLAVTRIRKALSEDITLLRVVRAKTGTMLELKVLGIKFDLQYCAASLVAQRFPEILNFPRTHAAFNLPIHTLSKLKPARDLAYLRSSIPDMAQYRLAHLLLKAWAISRGLYSAKFGLLGGINISVLLVPVCKVLAAEKRDASTADVLTTFFHHYARFDWENDIVFDPLFHNDLTYHRSLREPMCLLGWHTPSLNTALNSSKPSMCTVSSEMRRASSLITEESITWDRFLNRNGSMTLTELTAQSATEFLHSYKSYVRIETRYWGSSPGKGRRYIGWLESRCVSVLVDIDRRIPAIAARIWPARFSQAMNTCNADHQGGEQHCSYLIGLDWQPCDQATGRTKEENNSAEDALLAILREFVARIQSNEKYFDQTSCWILASVTGANNVRKLRLNEEPGFDASSDDTDSEGDLDLDLEERSQDEDSAATATFTETLLTSRMEHQKPGNALNSEGSGKLRTAADVMNRLRWDAAMDPSDYVIGYQDRFVGIQEKSLDQWKSDQTDEEFIPQHRIEYFRRKSDGIFVWDKKARVDTIFGSGN